MSDRPNEWQMALFNQPFGRARDLALGGRLISQDSNPRRRRLRGGKRRRPEVLLVFLVFVIAAASWPPDSNEAHYLTKAKHYWDGQFAAGDFYLGTRDAHTGFFLLAGWPTMFVSLGAVAWIGRFAAWMLLAWAWVRLHRAVMPRRGSPALTAALFLVGTESLNFAGEWVVGGFEAKPLAYVLVLLGLEALVRRRWNRVWIMLGGASAIHVLVGGWSLVLSAIVWFREPRRPSLIRMTPALLVGAALSLGGLLPALLLNRDATASGIDQAARIYVYDRLPHHLAPTRLPPGEQVTRAIRHGALVGSFALLCLMGGAGRRHRRLRAWIWSAAGLAAVGLALSFVSTFRPDLAARALRNYWFRSNDFGMAAGVALFSLRGVAVLEVRHRQTAGAILRAALVIVAVGHLGLAVRERYLDPRPPADRDSTSAASYQRWVEVCGWIAAHVQPGSRFLTPLDSQSFVWRTGLGQVVTRKDIPQDAAGIIEWRSRIDNIYFTEAGGTKTAYASLAEQEEERLLQLAERYDAQFVLTVARPALDLPLLHANAVYAVYDVSGRP